MPSGKVHNAINLSVLSAGTVGWFLLGQPLLEPAQAASLLLGGLIGTFLITPDLDLGDQNVEAKNNWGALGFIWYPYGRLSRHRGQAHSYIRGPVMRLLYLAALGLSLTFLIRLSGLLSVPQLNLTPETWTLLGFLGGGYLAAQWMHLIADGIYPWQRDRL